MRVPVLEGCECKAPSERQLVKALDTCTGVQDGALGRCEGVWGIGYSVTLEQGASSGELLHPVCRKDTLERLTRDVCQNQEENKPLRRAQKKIDLQRLEIRIPRIGV